jgi:hypothetical protein
MSERCRHLEQGGSLRLFHGRQSAFAIAEVVFATRKERISQETF